MRSRKRWLRWPAAVVFAMGLALLTPPAQANAPSPPSDSKDRPFGLGVLLGEPTGVSAKYWLTPRTAFDAAAAWSFGNNDSFDIHVSYLWHELRLLKVENKTAFDFYYGIGVRMVFDTDTKFGARVPFGLAYRFQDPAIEIFLELAPILDLAPSTDLDFNGGVGARYYF